MSENILIIGAGVGGLATAVRLAGRGHKVRVLEKGKGPGGRCGQLSFDGFTFDTGPTLLLMPEVLDELFASVGRRREDYLDLERCDPNYKIHFDDDSHATFSTDLVKMQHELERIEKGSFGRYLEFLAKGHAQYKISLERFVGRNFDSIWQFITPGNVAKIREVKALSMMYDETARYFKDDRLRAALTFQTMYLGISPFKAPAVYGLLPYTELAVGIWFPKGGLYAVPLALEKLAKELGVVIDYGVTVSRIAHEQGRAQGAVLSDGSLVPADVVVCNADWPWAQKHLLGRETAGKKRIDDLRYTSSAFMFYWGANKQIPELLHHNVFFGGDYAGSFDDIFENNKTPKEPSFYINVPARSDPSLAPSGKDGLYVLIPVPAGQTAEQWKEQTPVLRRYVFDRLAKAGIRGVEEAIVSERTFTPDRYFSDLNLERGAAFGLSHDFFQVGPFRPKNQDADISNLYYAGASTQPGTGLPMVMISARLCAERIAERQRSQVAAA